MQNILDKCIFPFFFLLSEIFYQYLLGETQKPEERSVGYPTCIPPVAPEECRSPAGPVAASLVQMFQILHAV